MTDGSQTHFDLNTWVEEGPAEQRSFRAAVHVILIAIAQTPSLQTDMVMKGGILITLGYQGNRFTQDIDFSTPKHLEEFDQQAFCNTFDEALTSASAGSPYNLECKLQSFRREPPRSDADFPTLRLTVGYADRSSQRAMRRLRDKRSSNVVKIDHSLNEQTGVPVSASIDDDLYVLVYNLEELVAEKFRAVLQQEERNRYRRQDAYDLYQLLCVQGLAASPDEKVKILQRLTEKSRARNLNVNQMSFNSVEIKQRSQRDYHLLADEIEGSLPDFDMIFDAISDYYRSLPWGNN